MNKIQRSFIIGIIFLLALAACSNAPNQIKATAPITSGADESAKEVNFQLISLEQINSSEWVLRAKFINLGEATILLNCRSAPGQALTNSFPAFEYLDSGNWNRVFELHDGAYPAFRLESKQSAHIDVPFPYGKWSNEIPFRLELFPYKSQVCTINQLSKKVIVR